MLDSRDELALQRVEVLKLLANDRAVEERGSDHADRCEGIQLRLVGGRRSATASGEEAQTASVADQWLREREGNVPDIPARAADELLPLSCLDEQGGARDRPTPEAGWRPSACERDLADLPQLGVITGRRNAVEAERLGEVDATRSSRARGPSWACPLSETSRMSTSVSRGSRPSRIIRASPAE